MAENLCVGIEIGIDNKVWRFETRKSKLNI